MQKIYKKAICVIILPRGYDEPLSVVGWELWFFAIHDFPQFKWELFIKFKWSILMERMFLQENVWKYFRYDKLRQKVSVRSVVWQGGVNCYGRHRVGGGGGGIPKHKALNLKHFLSNIWKMPLGLECQRLCAIHSIPQWHELPWTNMFNSLKLSWGVLKDILTEGDWNLILSQRNVIFLLKALKKSLIVV